MAQIVELKAEVRQGVGRKASEKLRELGRIPVVLYGHGKENINLTLPSKTFTRSFDEGSRFFSIDIDGAKESAMVVDVQWHVLTDVILHVDLQRKNLQEKVQVYVAVKTKGEPVGIKAGGMIEKHHMNIQVECSVVDIPEEFKIDISHLELGDALHVGDFKMPANVELLEAETLVVLKVSASQEEVVVEETDGEVEESETSPEVLTAKKEEEESK